MRRWSILAGLAALAVWALFRPEPAPGPVTFESGKADQVAPAETPSFRRFGLQESEFEPEDLDQAEFDERPQVVDVTTYEGVPSARLVFAGTYGLLGDVLSVRVERWTDLDGRFQWPELPLGYYELQVEASGYRRRVEEPFIVRGPVSVDEFEFELQAVAPLQGRVVDSYGRAIAGAKVTAWDPDGGGLDDDAPSEAITDEGGTFFLEVPDAESVHIALTHPSFVPTSTSVDLADGTSSVRLFRLASGSSTRVRVLDDNGSPVANAHVTCVLFAEDRDEIERSIEAETNGAGYAELVLGDTHAATFLIEARGHETLDEEFDLPAEDPKELEFVLHATDTVAFYVQRGNGHDAAGAAVYVSIEGEQGYEETSAEGVVGDDGWVELALPLGRRAVLVVDDASSPDFEETIDVLEPRHVIVLSAPAWIRARIWDAEFGRSAARVRWETEASFENLNPSADDGTFMLGPFAPGFVRFDLTGEGEGEYTCDECMEIGPGITDRSFDLEPATGSAVARAEAVPFPFPLGSLSD